MDVTFSASNKLTFKLNAPLLIVSTIGLTILTFFAYRESLQTIQKITDRETQFIIDTIVLSAETNNTNANIRRIVNTLSARKNIKRLSIIHRDNKIIADNRNENIGKTFNSTLTQNEAKINNISVNTPVNFLKDKVFYQSLKVNFIDPDINRLRPYTIFLVYNQESAYYLANLELKKFISAELIIVLLILATAYMVQQKILLRPIKSLIKTLEQQKNIAHPMNATIHSHDELGTLTQQYNILNSLRFKQENELKNTRKYIDGITNEVPVLLSYVDKTLVYRFVNKNYIRWFECPEQSFLNKPIQDTLGEEAFNKLQPYIKSTLAGNVSSFEIEIPYKHGISRFIHATYTPDKDANGDTQGYFVCIEDISITKENEAKLEKYMNELEFQAWALEESKNEAEKARQIAEKAAKSKSDFLSTMSHEIRTPMNGVLGMAELLNSTKLDNTQQTYVQTILNSGKLLITIINDILDYSKIEAGKVNLELIPFNLKNTLTDILNLMTETCDKNIDISLLYPETMPHTFIGDPSRIRQIIFNLVGNAIKFTNSGYVKIRTNFKNDLLQIAIEDTGIGITEEQMEYLFESFNQADKSTTRKFGGTGLGLAISKRLSSLMGGDITVESTYTKGTTFYITLPLKVSSQNLQDNAQASANEVETLQGNILVVEDTLTNQMVATAMLKQLGLTVEIANNGKEAIEKCRAKHYDLIYMDCRMPVMDGYEATKILTKEKHPSSGVPIIALTANATPQDRERCHQAGMADIMTKPFSLVGLQKNLSTWLNK